MQSKKPSIKAMFMETAGKLRQRRYWVDLLFAAFFVVSAIQDVLEGQYYIAFLHLAMAGFIFLLALQHVLLDDAAEMMDGMLKALKENAEFMQKLVDKMTPTQRKAVERDKRHVN